MTDLTKRLVVASLCQRGLINKIKTHGMKGMDIKLSKGQEAECSGECLLLTLE